jgi:hypothetical protein
MPELVANCPRCGTKNTTFDVVANSTVGYANGQPFRFETTCLCRHCERNTVFETELKSSYLLNGVRAETIASTKGSVADFIQVMAKAESFDFSEINAPGFLPTAVENAFKEAQKCRSIDCWNAAGAMFRACLDLATKDKLEQSELSPGLNRIERNLGLRLKWMFEQEIIPTDLQSLADSVKEDGNDGAHDLSLTVEDCADLADFTKLLLERIYTEPGKIEAAAKRREARRNR